MPRKGCSYVLVDTDDCDRIVMTFRQRAHAVGFARSKNLPPTHELRAYPNGREVPYRVIEWGSPHEDDGGWATAFSRLAAAS